MEIFYFAPSRKVRIRALSNAEICGRFGHAGPRLLELKAELPLEKILYRSVRYGRDCESDYC
jgi:hypothetical protein